MQVRDKRGGHCRVALRKVEAYATPCPILHGIPRIGKIVTQHVESIVGRRVALLLGTLSRYDQAMHVQGGLGLAHCAVYTTRAKVCFNGEAAGVFTGCCLTKQAPARLGHVFSSRRSRGVACRGV